MVHIKVTEKIILGKKDLYGAIRMMPSMIAYMGAVVLGVSWFADIDAVMTKIPYYKKTLQIPYEDDKRIYIHPRRQL